MTSPENDLRLDGAICEPARRSSVIARARQFVADNDGAALIEYGLMVLLIAVLCIVMLQTIGSKVSNGFNSANALLP